MSSRSLTFGPPANSGGRDAFLRGLRPAVLPIVVLEPDGTVRPVGTCFVVSCTGREALALTAKHNVDYMTRVDGRKPTFAPSTPAEFRVLRYEHHALTNIKMFVAYWTPDDVMIPCEIAVAWHLENGVDVAALLLRVPDELEATFTHRLAISSRGPRVGDQVHAIGYTEMSTSDHLRDLSGVISAQTVDLPLKGVGALVQRLYGRDEYRLLKWPCYELNCTLDPGMSGGPIVAVGAEGELIAWGVVSSGATYAPEGIASTISPALVMRIGAKFSFLPTTHPSLLECIEAGMIRDVAHAQNYVTSDASWREFAAPPFTLENASDFQQGGAFVVEVGDSSVGSSRFSWLTAECAYLGRINQHNGDEAEYLIVSEEFRTALLAVQQAQGEAKFKFVEARQPYVWFQVGDEIFRFFVLTLTLKSIGELPVKILSDARRDKPEPVA